MKFSWFLRNSAFILISLFLFSTNAFPVIIGDINDSKNVDLRDAVIGLRVCSGLDVQDDIFVESDVNNDNKIGIEEVIYALQYMAKKRMNYSLGYLGNPADYENTIQDFRSFLAFEQFAAQLPSSFDWKSRGKVSPAKDQGTCGSCWAFASTGAFESKISIKGGNLLDLSEQQLVSCDTASKGCLGGTLTALKYWYNKGPMLEDCASYCECDKPCSQLSHCTELTYRTKNYYTLNTNNMDEIKSSIYNDGPAIYGYVVYYDFFTFWHNGTNNQIYKQDHGSLEGYHAVLLIGWNDVKGAWLCKNSWGETTGPNGDGTFWVAYSGHKNNILLGIGNSTIAEGPKPPDDRKPVFRFYSTLANNHYYTLLESEKNMLITDVMNWEYNYEGIEFYAYKDQKTATYPIYRFYSPTANNHFYTISEEEKNTLLTDPDNWKYEGIKFYAYKDQYNDTFPVFRFYSPTAKNHFYTVSVNAKNTLLADPDNWRYEGIEFYAYKTEG